MRPILAVAGLTFRTAFRFRLVPVLSVLLVASVFLLPAFIKHTGKAQEFVQIVLTYTLGLTTAVLGLTTLWLACGTLAGDIEDCQMQVVAVKPIARWQIWLGKWLGIMMLNGLMLAVCAGAIYAQLQWRARGLSQEQLEVLNNEVLVARGSFKESLPDLEPVVEEEYQKRLENPAFAEMPRSEARRIIREQLKAGLQVVPPAYTRVWRIDLGSVKSALAGRPLYLRIKFFVSEKSASGTYWGLWEVGPPESPRRVQDVKNHAAETFYEFSVPPDLFDAEGLLTVEYTNQNDTAVLFPLDEGFEVLYRAGGFGLNYVRGVAILFCWLALLAALGLAAASFLSFPVAAFLALGLLIVAFSTGTMSLVIEQGTIREVNPNTGEVEKANLFDHVTVGFFKGLLGVINLVRGFSPIDSLSTGRSVSWTQLVRAIGQIVLLMGGLFAAIGIAIFTRRELATAQGKG